MSQFESRVIPPQIQLAPVSVGVPLILTNFEDSTFWIPFGHSMADAITFTNGGLNLKTSGARIASQHIAVGVKPRFKLFPDLSGLLEFRWKIENYTHPIDFAGGDFGYIGMGFSGMGERSDYIGIGGIGVAAPSQFHKCSKADFHSGVFASQTVTATGGFSSAEFKITISNQTTAPSRYLMGTVGPPITVCQKSLDGAAFSNFETPLQGPWGVDFVLTNGFYFWFGLFASSRNQNLGARFVNFSLHSGLGVIGA